MTDEDAAYAALGRRVARGMAELRKKFDESEELIRAHAMLDQLPEWDHYQIAYVHQLDALQFFFTTVLASPLPDAFRTASVGMGKILKQGALHPMFTPKKMRDRHKMGRTQHSATSVPAKIMAVIAVNLAVKSGMTPKAARVILAEKLRAKGYRAEPETIRDWCKDKTDPNSPIGKGYSEVFPSVALWFEAGSATLDEVFERVAVAAGMTPG